MPTLTRAIGVNLHTLSPLFEKPLRVYTLNPSPKFGEKGLPIGIETSAVDYQGDRRRSGFLRLQMAAGRHTEHIAQNARQDCLRRYQRGL